jgi:phosphatidylserine/phosphatidylglycerophosphate/cardiolipin synthase-like enzyme
MSAIFLKYIQDNRHYSEVLELVKNVQHSLWIGTADIKDVYMKNGIDETIPFLGVLAGLIKRGVEVRLIHAKEPGPNFRADFDKYPILSTQLERVLCPRVHFKIMLFDLQTAYIGSANLTGAGIGMKSSNRRNFEAGVLTNNPEIVKAAFNQFDNVWMGSYCKTCGRKAFCGDRIV